MSTRTGDRALVRGSGLGSPRNGLAEAGGYVYRGSLRLADELPFECEGGCGRRLETDRWPLCAVCRDTGKTYHEGARRYGPGPARR